MPARVLDSDDEGDQVRPTNPKQKIKNEHATPSNAQANGSQINGSNHRGSQASNLGDEDESPDRDSTVDHDASDATRKSPRTDDADEEDAGEEPGENVSPRGSKRARANSDGAQVKKEKKRSSKGRKSAANGTQEEEEAPEEQDGEGDQDDEAPRPRLKKRVVTLPRGADGYVPGSIVRMKLGSFLTYDDCQFRPGPHLNMVLGPNGTGKSSIACAIAIGLGWSPAVLGRATDLSAFVKHGYDEAFVEVELKGREGRSNLVIRRTLNRKNNSSRYTVNGEHATAKEVKDRVASLNVQVGNLCSFLPQDKVSEFAQMTPVQLLRETQKAAGAAELTDWHEQLIGAGKELKAIQNQVDGEQADITRLEDMNKRDANEVRKWEERQLLQSEVDFHELLYEYTSYGVAKRTYDTAKDERNRIGNQLQEVQNKNKPLENLKTEWSKKKKDIEKRRLATQENSKKKYSEIRKKKTSFEKIAQDCDDVQKQMEILKKNELKRKQEIESLKAQIGKLETEIANPPEMEDAAEIDTDIKTWNAAANENRYRQEEFQKKQRVYIDKGAEFKARLERANQELHELEDRSLQRVKTLIGKDRDCGDTVMWLRKNQHRFKMQVFEPAFVSVDVLDKRYANAVEQCFSWVQLRTFVVQCDEDYKLLNDLINDKTSQTLGHDRDAGINIWFRPKDYERLQKPPMQPDKMKALGFDCYAIDQVEAPDGIQWFLRKELNMHRTAVALKENQVNAAAAMEAVTSPDSANGPPPSTSFITGDVLHVVSRSSYGKKAAQNATRPVKPASTLVHAGIDQTAKHRLEQEKVQAREELENIELEIGKFSAEEKEINQAHTEAKKNLEAATGRKKKLQAQLKAHSTKEHKLEAAKKKLVTEENQPSTKEKREQLKKQLSKHAEKRMKLALEYKDLTQSAFADHETTTRLGLEFTQASANLIALEALGRVQEATTVEIAARFDEARAAFDAAKTEATEKRKTAMAAISEASEENKQRMTDMSEDEKLQLTLEGLQEQIDQLKARLDMNYATNKGVIDAYHKRVQDIEDMQKRLEGKEKRLKDQQKKVKRTHDLWYPALQDLVTAIGEKFSAAFDRIGCAGEIRIKEEPDYDQWAIDILVKFREKERLQILTAQRQSGGERSLTTILYLMSLTEHAKAPFSLVDEINQGMDQRAERAVHNQLVEVTCKADSGQYFLITPKLLPGLTYHPLMRILCVNNGEWLPDEKGIGNMNTLIDGYVNRGQGH